MRFKQSGELSLNTFSNNLLAPLCRNLVVILGLMLAIVGMSDPALAQPDWVTSEGETIENGLDPGDTFPRSSGELSVRFNNTAGGTDFVSSGNIADTLATHLSLTEFDTTVSPVRFVSPGDSVTFVNGLWNTGNGSDSYSIRQSGALISTWDTGIFLDANGNGVIDSGDTDVTDLAEINDVVSLDTQQLILEVTVPSGSSVNQRDTFAVFSRSLRTEDPEPGEDTTFMVVQTDTSSLDVFNPNPPFDFVDTQAITGDSTVSLRFPAIEEVDEQNVTYVDPAGTQAVTGFHPHVTSDSGWTLTNLEGQHTFHVQYKYNDGQLSDTYTDTIELDHTAPQNPQVEINNGDSTTTSLNVNLTTLTSTDPNPSRVVIDNDSSFTDVPDTRPFPGADTSWTLNDDPGTAFVKFIDGAGNVSSVVSDTIDIDLSVLSLDKDPYVGIRDEATVTVNDFGANNNSGQVETVTAQVTSTLDDEGITITLTETGASTGRFVGTFGFTEGFSDESENKIFVEPGAKVSVTYVDSSSNSSQDTSTWLRQAGTDQSVEDVRTWPNPFRPLEGKPFVFQNLPADQGMEIMIFNVSGQLVRKLTVGRGIEFNPNGNIARWFGKNDVGDRVASGTYIYVVNSKFGTKRGKLTLVK